MADEKPKEGVKTEGSEHINLKVAGQDGSVVQFKIKRHTALNKLMKAYCDRQTFIFNFRIGRRCSTMVTTVMFDSGSPTIQESHMSAHKVFYWASRANEIGNGR
ncbi:small ubiquitin-related modifier 2 isoform X2 [Phyllopteryx taeniolatus]|uniref:small ubiquitin-related modifier 2 isoform X2 n=1 Tax=Phyllopteryx taeniolatus TaxID=161469 RepID=UPI002AD3D3E5|nr:small ubiquitin-related modifier 2 isoform X2 [Phyllopteryx taeniolatus]